MLSDLLGAIDRHIEEVCERSCGDFENACRSQRIAEYITESYKERNSMKLNACEQQHCVTGQEKSWLIPRNDPIEKESDGDSRHLLFEASIDIIAH